MKHSAQAPHQALSLLEALREKRRLAAPSWVRPGTMEENCLFLSEKVDEAGLLFFEAEASLAYGRKDLPLSLADLSLTYHLHFPLDLPWHHPAEAADICLALLEKTAFLSGTQGARRPFPHSALAAVLHPPDADRADSGRAGRLLASFVRRFTDCGGCTGTLLLENTAGNDLLDLEGLIVEFGLGVCPDLGHMLAYGQERLLERAGLLERAALLHLNAPAKNSGGHLPLGALDSRSRELARRLCLAVPPRTVLMLELFRWQDILDSLPLICSWLLPGD